MTTIPGLSKSLCRRLRGRTRFSFVGCASTHNVGNPRKLTDVLFGDRCTNRTERPLWDTLTRAKSRIIEFMWAPDSQAGVQFAAVKFLQRVILVQSRGVADPRVSWSSFRLYVLVRIKASPCSPKATKQKRPKPLNGPSRPPIHRCCESRS